MYKGSVLLNTAVLLMFSLFIGGLALLPSLSYSPIPKISGNEIKVTFSWPNAAPRVLEGEVTSRLEAAFGLMRGVKAIGSTSQFGQGSIEIAFKEGVDLAVIRLEISGIIKRIYPRLPTGVSYPQISTGLENTLPVITIDVSSSRDYSEMMEYIDKRILPRLQSHYQIRTEVRGGIENAFELQINQSIKQQLKIDLKEIEEAIKNQFKSVFVGYGYASNGSQTHIRELILRSNQQLDDIKLIPVKKIGARIIYINDLGVVKKIMQPQRELFRVNGMNSIKIVVSSIEGSSKPEMLQWLHPELEMIKQHAPDHYSIRIKDDSQLQLKSVLEKFGIKLLLSVVLCGIFSMIMFRDVKKVFVLMSIVFISFTIACVLFRYFNVSFHQYSIPAVSFLVPVIACNTLLLFYYLSNDRKSVIPMFLAGNASFTLLMVTVLFITERDQAFLIDFVRIAIITNCISLLVMLTVVHLIDPFKKANHVGLPTSIRRFLLRVSIFWKTVLYKLSWLYLVIIIIGVGIPVYKLPRNIDGESPASHLYNRIFGSHSYVFNVEPLLRKVFGGAIQYLGSEDVQAYLDESNPEKQLNIRVKLSDGGSTADLNSIIKPLEVFIISLLEMDVKEFRTSIEEPGNGLITIEFKENAQENGVLAMKGSLESKLMTMGGIEWAVYGVGEPFSNMRVNQYKTEKVMVKGYNYDELIGYAELLRKELMQNKRVIGAEIIGSKNQKIANEYSIKIEDQITSIHSLSKSEAMGQIKERFDRPIFDIYFKDKPTEVHILSRDKTELGNSEWFLFNDIQTKSSYKLSEIGQLDVQMSALDIVKKDQEYILYVTYEFLGPSPLARKVKNQLIDSFDEKLQLGYTIGLEEEWDWRSIDKDQYLVISIAVFAVFFVVAVLFESLRNALLVIVLILCSFVGQIFAFNVFNIPNTAATFAAVIILFCFVTVFAIVFIHEFWCWCCCYFCEARGNSTRLVRRCRGSLQGGRGCWSRWWRC